MKDNLMVRWDITQKCNLSCKHCLTADMYNENTELTLAERYKIIDSLVAGGVKRVHLLGGESTIVPEIVNIVEYMTNKGVSVSLNTNGVIMAENMDVCTRFAENRVDISFSIDGASKESHERIRGNNTFDKVIKAANNYSSVNLNNELVSAFYFTLTPDNKNDNFEDLFELADLNKINNIVMGILIPMGSGKINYQNDGLSCKDIINTTHQFAILSQKYKHIKVSFPFQTPLLLKYLTDFHKREFGLCYSKCKAGTFEFSLQPNGIINPCVFIKGLKASQISFSSENNLIFNSLQDILNNDFYNAVRDNLDNISLYSEIEPCDKCPYNIEMGICRPCSYQHMNTQDSNDDFHKNELCKYILSINGNNYYR